MFGKTGRVNLVNTHLLPFETAQSVSRPALRDKKYRPPLEKKRPPGGEQCQKTASKTRVISRSGKSMSGTEKQYLQRRKSVRSAARLDVITSPPENVTFLQRTSVKNNFGKTGKP